MPPKFAYSEEQMEKAIRAVSVENMSKRKAAEYFNVPRSTLSDKILGKTPMTRRKGPNPYISKKEEAEIVE